MKHCSILLLALICLNHNIFAQGCVAVRGAGGPSCGMMTHGNHYDTTGLTLSVNTRYFNSFRHFVGTVEQKQRMELGTQVINHTYSMDLGLTKILNKKWSMSVYVPIIANTRSSLYEHGGTARYSTESFGLGDLRIAGYLWLTDPAKLTKLKIQVGLGIKFATGDYRYTDRFYTATGSTNKGPVDQSIQLGDGGTGLTTELNVSYTLSPKMSLYGNAYYLVNPREQNGVSTARGAAPSATSISYTSDLMSVPDQYLLRGGMNYQVNNWTFSGGLRFECIPVNDLIGGSEGFRRPGKILTAEPGITYMFKKMNVYAYLPVSINRDRTQSVPDKIRTKLTGTYAQGDAAFADYLINIGCSIKL